MKIGRRGAEVSVKGGREVVDRSEATPLGGVGYPRPLAQQLGGTLETDAHVASRRWLSAHFLEPSR